MLEHPPPGNCCCPQRQLRRPRHRPHPPPPVDFAIDAAGAHYAVAAGAHYAVAAPPPFASAGSPSHRALTPPDRSSVVPASRKLLLVASSNVGRIPMPQVSKDATVTAKRPRLTVVPKFEYFDTYLRYLPTSPMPMPQHCDNIPANHNWISDIPQYQFSHSTSSSIVEYLSVFSSMTPLRNS